MRLSNKLMTKSDQMPTRIYQASTGMTLEQHTTSRDGTARLIDPKSPKGSPKIPKPLKPATRPASDVLPRSVDFNLAQIILHHDPILDGQNASLDGQTVVRGDRPDFLREGNSVQRENRRPDQLASWLVSIGREAEHLHGPGQVLPWIAPVLVVLWLL